MTEKLLLETLDEFASRRVVADLWLRDDDATQPTEKLERLLALSSEFSVPVTLAVIPEPTSEELAKRLSVTTDVNVAVHGWAHRNHATPAEKKRELGLHRPLETVIDDLTRGFGKLKALHSENFVPMLVPPWNRIDDEIIAELPEKGFEALSVYGPEQAGTVRLLNTHVDVIDWRGTRSGKDHDLLFGEIVVRMHDALATGGMTGVLTHHLDHDESVWAFLLRLFHLTADHPGCRWRSSRQWLVSP